MALAGIIATSTQVAITHPEAGSAETEVLTSSAGELYERQPLLQRAAQADPRVPVIYVPTGPPSDAEDAFLVSASLAGSGPAPAVAEPTVESSETESSIESILSLGGTASRVTPVDPSGGGGTPSGGTVEVSSDGAAAGEPY